MLDSSAQQSDSVIHINTHIYSFFRFFFIIVYYKIRVQFPMLYSRSLLATLHTAILSSVCINLKLLIYPFPHLSSLKFKRPLVYEDIFLINVMVI